MEELKTAYGCTIADNPYASFKEPSQKEPTELFGFDWDVKGFEQDIFEGEPAVLDNAVEGEENVFELLSGMCSCCAMYNDPIHMLHVWMTVKVTLIA